MEIRHHFLLYTTNVRASARVCVLVCVCVCIWAFWECYSVYFIDFIVLVYAYNSLKL